MLRRIFSGIPVAVVVVAGMGDNQQSAAPGWRYCQRWNQELDSVRSRVIQCSGQDPLPRIAFDDFLVNREGGVTITKIAWWGVLTNGWAMEEPPGFRIAFYSNAACRPDQLEAELCIDPETVEQVGMDCLDKEVFKFTAQVSVNLGPGRHWISIAEDEQNSPTPEDDFRWSGHRYVKNCRALSKSAAGGTQRIRSWCDDEPMDLAFCLNGN